MSNPFDYANSILQNKKNLIIDELTEKEYQPFLINRTLSYHKDCVLYANEMNRRHLADKKLQYDFLLNTVRSQKRPFAKWAKSEKDDDLLTVKAFFGFSDVKAREALRLLKPEEIKLLKEKMSTGGIKNTK